MNYGITYEDLHGRGLGDPDVHGHYPGDGGEKDCLICTPRKSIKHETPSVYREKHWTENMNAPFSRKGSYEPREFGDNDPASPEQAGW